MPYLSIFHKFHIFGGLRASLLFPLVLLFCFPASAADELSIYFIDVEQGDSTLIISPSGNTLLIDSGKNGHGDRIKAILDAEGISQIDHFVATHYHEDHYGGIDDLVNLGIPVTTPYDRGDKAFLPSSKLSQATYVDYETAVGSRAEQLTRGETIPLDPDMLVTAISAGGVVLGETSPVHADEENDMSISLLISYGSFQLFVGGDIEEPTEEKIADNDLVTDIDIYQSNHHGSHSSSSEPFMEDLLPSLVVISNGSTRRYQHPRQVTLDTYSDLTPSPVVLQTNKYVSGGDDFGNVPDEFIADIPPNDEAGTIHVTVNLDAGTYTARYRKSEMMFNVKDRGGIPQGVVIARLLPQPPGSDRENEQVTLANTSSSQVDISDMVLQDISGRIWNLDGTIDANSEREIIRNGMPMSLNDAGDTISLMTQSGTVIDSFQYTSSEFDTELITGH